MIWPFLVLLSPEACADSTAPVPFVAAKIDSSVSLLPIDVVAGFNAVDPVQGGRTKARVLLPEVTLNFPYPAVTGRSIRVASGDNLQSALNRARRGDEVVLAAGAEFVGNYTLPSLPGSAADGWVIVRGDKSDRLPPIGTRVSTEDELLMPSIITRNADPALKTAPGASGWRIVGLEVSIQASFTGVHYGLLWLGEAGAPQTTLGVVPSDIVLDRMYIHAQPTTNITRCVALNSARTQVSDSYITECHAKGYDSQAIWGGNGPGPFRIENNTLEGAGENIMFGGSDPAIPGLVPSDIEIRRNYIHTPLTWKGLWTRKNLLEFKNARRVLVEGNVFDGVWLDGQTGWAVVVKSANQSGNCRWCRTTDVTFRLNLVRNAGAGINIAGVGDNTDVDSVTRRILIQESVFDELGAGAYNGDKRGFQLLAGSSDVTVERTVISGSLTAALMLDNIRPSQRATFRDNVWSYGQYGTIASGNGPGSASLRVGAPSAVWEKMIFVGPQRAAYPMGTGFVSEERHAATAVRVRAAVDSATAGVVR